MKYSIVITTYGKHLEDYLRPCVESIIKYTNMEEVEVIIVANGCEPAVHTYVSTLGDNFKLFWFDEGIGYTRAANFGMGAATGDFVILLNDDTTLLEQYKNAWLDVLREPFDKDPMVGITGPVKFTWDCGGTMRTAMAFWCVMISRALIAKIGFLDEIFNPGMGEDGDYSIRAEMAGFRLIQVPSDGSRQFGEGVSSEHFPIYHKGNGTFAEPGMQKDETIARNNKILAQMYGKKAPRVSIIVPTHNHLEDALIPCLRSLFQFTDMEDKEVIVVANGCNDGTEEYVQREYGDRVRLLTLPQAAGYITPVNYGAKHSNGEYILLFDNDCVLLEQPKNMWFQLLMEPFQKYENCGMSGPFAHPYEGLGVAIHSGCALYKRSVWDEVGGFDTIFGYGYLSDTDMSLRIAKNGYRVVGVPEGKEPQYKGNTFVISFPIYHPSKTTTMDKSKNVSLMRKNREILYRRHGMKPKYSIVIPTYNHLEDCLKPCLESVKKFTDLTNTEVIVVANGCKDNTAAYVDSFGHPFKLLWFDEGLGFTKATNEGIKVAQGEYVILLNNDVILLDQPHNEWIRMLEEPFLKEEKVGITGPLSLFDNYAGDNVMIFFCVMMPRRLFDELGLLDECFSPGGGEDIDFCMKTRIAGYKQVVVPNNDVKMTFTNVGGFPIYHLGEGTFSEKEWPEYGNSIIKENGLKNLIRYNKHIKLNVGSGGVDVPGYISVDKYDRRANVILDAFDLASRFPENSVEEILASHVFEHVNPYKSVDMLKRWLYVLKPGGKLIMELPNIEELCKDFVTASKGERYGILNCIYGSVNTTDKGAPSDITSPHLWGWYPEMMWEHLIWAGFTNITFGPEQIPHPLKNFRVEATKPVPVVAEKAAEEVASC